MVDGTQAPHNSRLIRMINVAAVNGKLNQIWADDNARACKILDYEAKAEHSCVCCLTKQNVDALWGERKYWINEETEEINNNGCNTVCQMMIKRRNTKQQQEQVQCQN